jgi:hypothetical protein
MTPDKPFKTNEWEWIFFILMNLIAPPLGLIVGLLFWGWYGFFGSIVLFYVIYRLWKSVGGYEDSKLTFNPTMSFGNKKWKM